MSTARPDDTGEPDASEREAAEALSAFLDARHADPEASAAAFVPDDPSVADAFRKAVEALGVLYESPDAVAGNAAREMMADQDAPDQIATPPPKTAEPASTAPDTPQRIGSRIGSYRIVEVLGRGGMGVVYLAEQEKPRREVAMKVIRPGLTGQERLRRFEHEVQVLGRLQHPAVAQIYEAGMHDAGSGPQPYFAMELIKGTSLASYARTRQLGTRARLELIAKVCDGVHHAHQKGVIHRDLKPGNILVDQAGQPKILDFGVARATDSDIQTTTLQTDIGQLVGTVPYMSPEQVAGDPDELDTRSDVYALGVVAYELLAERLPYDVANKMIHEAVRVIREDEPTPLSSVNRVFRGDVETIVAKALEKEKSRRYQSASDLASDIRRYLADEPVVARPPSAAYQMRKFARRNKALVGGVAAVFVVLVAGIVATGVALGREADQRRIAEAAEQEQSRARQEAEAARAETQERAEELEIVTKFQQSMLSEIDAEEMGRALFADLRARVRESLEAEGVSPEEINSAVAVFDQTLRRANATDAALKLVDKQMLSRAVKTIESDFADRPLVRAALQQTVADTYREVGLYPPAMPLQEAALETHRTELGNDHPDTLISIGNMGVLLEMMGKLEEAMPYFREALEGKRRVLGDDHPGTLTSINNTAALLDSMGKHAEAEPYYREALKGRRRVLGDDHPHTLTSINNMGFLVSSMGKLEEAIPYYREGLEGSRRVLGDDDPDTLTSISNMGFLLQSMGRLAEAEPYYHEALEGYRRVLGDDHPNTLGSISNMGDLLHSRGKLEEALGYSREALEGCRRVLGDDHPHTLTSINNMGVLLEAMGKLEEALGYSREALAGRRRVLGDDHPETLISVGGMGVLLCGMGRLKEAMPYHREALAGLRRVLGDDHPGTLASISNMGALLHRMGKYEEALGFFREALESRRRMLGDDHPDTLDSINNMAALLYAMGQLEEALGFFREVMEGYRRVLGDDHPNTLNSISNTALPLKSMGKLEEALGFFREALVGKRRVLGNDHPNTLISINNVGDLLVSMGELEEAEVLLAEAVDIAKRSLSTEHWFTGVFLGNHGKCLVELKRYADAETALLEAHGILEATLGAEHERTIKVVKSLADLYDAWHAAEPGAGYDAQAAEWRAKLEEEGIEAQRHKGNEGKEPVTQPASRPSSVP